MSRKIKEFENKLKNENNTKGFDKNKLSVAGENLEKEIIKQEENNKENEEENKNEVEAN